MVQRRVDPLKSNYVAAARTVHRNRPVHLF